MYILTISALLIIHASYAQPEDNETIIEPEYTKGLRYDLRTFMTCAVSCKRKVCSCCLMLVVATMCANIEMDPAKKHISFNVDISKRQIINLPLSVDFPEQCITTSIFGICFSAPMEENYPNSDTFKVCPSFYGEMNQQKVIGVGFSCWRYIGNLTFVNDNPLQFGVHAYV